MRIADLPATRCISDACHVDHAKYYQRLVRDLDGWSSASEIAPGRIRVSIPPRSGVSRRVVIVMTPAEWVDMFTVAHGSVDSAFDRVKQTLLAMKPHEGFAVYADYVLEPWTADTLPDPDEYLPEPGSGRWVPLGPTRERHRQVSDRPD